MTSPRLHLVLATLLISITLTSGCTAPDPTSEQPPAGRDPKAAPPVSATRVEAAIIQPSSAALRLVRPGEVEASREANIGAALGGFIEYVGVDVGDAVKKGALIARVDTRMQVAQRELAEVELDEARREYTRLASLGTAVASSRTDAAQTRLHRAAAKHRIAGIRAGRTIIRAPFAGVVTRVSAERGEIAAPGAPIAQIVQLDPAVVSVSIADRDVGGLKVGGKAQITVGALARPQQGTISRVEPTANAKTRAFRAEVEVTENTDLLRPGMIASVSFLATVASDAIVIPQEVLVTKLDTNGVFVVDDQSIARWRTLELGPIIGEQVVVEHGLSAGEKVVTLGQRGLNVGDALLITREGVCCTEGRIVFGASNQLAAYKGPEATKAPTKAPTKERRQ
ncbi:MAG: efflux RND transporter periplasmic adaptor subunit [Nannocystaceae bacterium]